MLEREKGTGKFFNKIVYEKHVPREHELVRIREEIDFGFVEEETKDLYDERMGRPAWSPGILFRMLFLEYYANLSDVQVSEQCKYNMLYRWFVGLDVCEETPDDTTLVIFRKRLGEERFERMFRRVIEQIKSKGLLKNRYKILDATHIVANVAIKDTIGLLRQARERVLKRIWGRYPVCGKKLQERYEKTETVMKVIEGEELTKELEKTREFLEEVRGKYGRKVDEEIEEVERMLYGDEKIVSLIDPEARWGYKTKDKPFCGYKVHIGCDESEIVTSLDVLSGQENEGKSENVRKILKKEMEQGIKYEAVVADALYDSAETRKEIHRSRQQDGERVKAYIPSRYSNKNLNRFRYDEKRDAIICPARNISIGKSPHGGGHIYYFSVESCRNCPYKDTCPPLNEGRVRVFVSEDQKIKLMDEDEERKKALKIRRTIERRFGIGKKIHGLGKARYWSRAKVAIQCFMTFIVMNLKRMIRLISMKKLKEEVLQAA